MPSYGLRQHVYFRNTLDLKLARTKFGFALQKAVMTGSAKGASDCRLWIVMDRHYPLWRSFRLEFTPSGKHSVYKATIRDHFAEHAAD